MKCDVEIDYAAVAMLGTGIATYEQYRKDRVEAEVCSMIHTRYIRLYSIGYVNQRMKYKSV
jgi:hypothetical protein